MVGGPPDTLSNSYWISEADTSYSSNINFWVLSYKHCTTENDSESRQMYLAFLYRYFMYLIH